MVAPAQRAAGTAARLGYLDSLKVLLTGLVIAHHAGQAYGPTGGRWPIFEPERAAILGPFFSVNAAFFMGLFFLISAYFLPAAFDRKGTAGFLRDRFVRLGIPLVVAYVAFSALEQQPDVAHLWFVGHLLIYALMYASWRALGLPRLALRLPSNRAIVAYGVGLAVVTFGIRIAFPIDRWVSVFGLLNVEVAHVPQYASLFALGLVAARERWLERWPTNVGMRWLTIGVGLAALRYAYALGGDAVPRLSGGGFSPESLLWSTWEAFICVGLCVGLPVLFRERFASPGRLIRWAARNAFGAYVLHIVPVVVGLQFALVGLSMDPLAKFAIVTVLGVPLSFALAAAVRRAGWRTL